MLPDFLCVGAAKAGTTTIHDVLSQSSMIFLPTAKEIHFFDNDANFARGAAWYESWFSRAMPGQLVGEVTPAYMTYDVVPGRIRETLGSEVKLLFTLREPVARAYSEFHHNRRRGFIHGEFREAAQLEFEKSELSAWERRKYSFISRGFYAKQIAKFLEVFPRRNMHFLVMEEDFGLDSQNTFVGILDFLGVERQKFDSLTASNVAYEPRSLLVQRWLFADSAIRNGLRKLVRSDSMRRDIRKTVMRLNAATRPPARLSASEIKSIQDQYFRDEIDRLEDLIDRDLNVWRDSPRTNQYD